MKTTSITLKISAIICYIYGALYIFSLVFIPIGIYCIVAGKGFYYKSNNLFDRYVIDNKKMKIFTTYSCVFCFPFGLISLIPYVKLVSNNIKITSNKTQGQPATENEEPVKNETASTQESEAEKIEKFNKLKSFREKGIITEEELELAREQLFGKKD